MGACLSYLNEPITEKVSHNEENEKLKVGASSMQGWRKNQEDAHNCILNYDENTAFFSVFDGHGGHEIAAYASQKLPDILKETEAYRTENYEKAFVDAFLSFDASLTSPEVTNELKKIIIEKIEEENDDEEEEENVSNLYEEATMPIEQVMEKYRSKLFKSKVKSVKRVPTIDKASVSSSSGFDKPCSSSSSYDSKFEVSSSVCLKKTDSSSNSISSTSEEMKLDTSENISTNSETSDDKMSSKNSSEGCNNVQNGDASSKTEEVDISSPQENGNVSKKGKGKAIIKKKPTTPHNSGRPKRSTFQDFAKLIADGNISPESEESDDEEDETFIGPADSSDDDDDLEESSNYIVEEEDSESDDEDDDEDDDEEDLEYQEGDKIAEYDRDGKDKPGYESGCTAVVALLRDNKLYVANAGDSRCVVCRNGKAIQMSFDHKPEDEPEKERISKAGGSVTADGRVNGRLNLSRAFGDYKYKENKELSDREQMITALPDVRTLTINPGEDEFMVLACDGIWNSMTNQEVVNFIKIRIDKGVTDLSQICEEMFDSCIAPHTMNDGTGCDNMTAIIVQFKTNKRGANEELQSDESTKKIKTDA